MLRTVPLSGTSSVNLVDSRREHKSEKQNSTHDIFYLTNRAEGLIGARAGEEEKICFLYDRLRQVIIDD